MASDCKSVHMVQSIDYYLKARHITGTVLGPWNTKVNKTWPLPWLTGYISLKGERYVMIYSM